MKENENNSNNPLFSKFIRAGHRYYYIDAKKDVNGANYIVLTESKSTGEGGQKQRHRIFVYEEDIQEFVESLLNVVDFIRSNEDGNTEQASEVSVKSEVAEPDVKLWEDEEIEGDWQKKWDEE